MSLAPFKASSIEFTCLSLSMYFLHSMFMSTLSFNIDFARFSKPFSFAIVALVLFFCLKGA